MSAELDYCRRLVRIEKTRQDGAEGNMGIQDRDYYRPEQSGLSMRGPRTVVGMIILINVVIWVVDGLFASQTHAITAAMAAKVGSLTKPWLWWQFLTYGFAHAPEPNHVLFNMLGLFFLGRDIEATYGRKEFLRLYLVLLVTGSVVWALSSKLSGAPAGASLIGASGAVAGVVVLYALNFPRRTLLVFFVLPMPAWLVGVLFVMGDAFGAMKRVDGDNIAYSVHLAGAATAFLYYQFRWNFTRLTGGRFSLDKLKPRPKLRLHDPNRPDRRQGELGDEVDRILAKIHRDGEASLTRKERRTLETASRQYQEKKQPPEDRDL